MEIGMGFWLGVFVGLVFGVIAVVVLVVSRRAQSSGRAKPPARVAALQETREIVRDPLSETRTSVTRVLPPDLPPAVRSAAPGGARRADEPSTARRERPENTLIVEEVESGEKQLAASIQEVRDMLLSLATLIARTESASGQAASAFATAKDTIHNLQSTQSPELQEAQRILLSEIDRVLTSNAALHSELDRANRGIAEQRQQIEELRVQARVDALTRVPNRAAFDERLSEYMSLFERTALVFSLLLVDIDHFKRVNDDHGHTSGDRILRGIASKISECVRNNDFVARYGGEEFAVILPAAPLGEAHAVADRIRADIEKTNFRMDRKTLKITISGGIAQCAPNMDATHLIEAADAALYQAKHRGRNRIVLAGDTAGDGTE